MDKFVHVNIGSTNGVLPVIALYTEGCFKDFYELRTPKGRCWVHKKWCRPVTIGVDIAQPGSEKSVTKVVDRREFAKDHWDQKHNHLSVDVLEDWYQLFRRDAAKYADSLRHKEAKTISPAVEHKAVVAAPAPEQPAKDVVVTAKPKRPHYVELSLFD